MVKNLFLIRHAEANAANKDTSDFNRRLSANGVNEAQFLGRYLKTLSVDLEVIYTSPALRTLETCSQVASAMDKLPRIISSEEYYEATRNVLVAAVNRLDDLFENVAIIGHNPSISMLYEYLVSRPRGVFSTGACAWLQVELDSWQHLSSGMCTEIDFYYPGQLNLE
ncbi:MAG: hypothetical protein COW03_06570 [Cytophagales bacterium CG12_big_fil_rev_8_21_14_0_65_40_12]|nr:MAG: hypothetical protein COW03_06570 [Cytophagales bacterium CG12_big_fil_rev_8_21_14_0_65_40_12]PIW03306.1 MAG: hypothetical protein COW40_15725 [Cytophagales bacterium CG17_big_fil_post_rev_8_21_14_2_50_40_13]